MDLIKYCFTAARGGGVSNCLKTGGKIALRIVSGAVERKYHRFLAVT